MLPASEYELLIEWHDPTYIDYVRNCLENNVPVQLSLTGHHHNRERVQACLWYAIERGLAVTVIPPAEAPNEVSAYSDEVPLCGAVPIQRPKVTEEEDIHAVKSVPCKMYSRFLP